jgi:tryptophan synthase beta chain
VQYRPSPLVRAHRLEKALDTPAHIYFKYEGLSAAGSHKPNTALAQAFYNKEEGIKRIATETGAGQWGSALSHAGAVFGLEIKVYMVRASYDQKPYRRILMETYGASVTPSPSPETEAGKAILAQDPKSPGSLGIAISEAVEDTMKREDTHYSLGSVLNHVMLHQTVVGEESLIQMEMAGEEPDIIIGCVGGGSNFAGLFFPWIGKTLRGGRKYQIICVEPLAAPTLTRGKYMYDYGDTAKMAPMVMMYTLGHDFVPKPIHAGGLRYHGMAPLVSQAIVEGLLAPRAYHQTQCYEAALLWARTEGTVPAPETSHAIACAVDEARRAKDEGKEKVILFCYSGHGLMDLSAYDKYLSGQLSDHELPQEEIDKALNDINALPRPETHKTGRW